MKRFRPSLKLGAPAVVVLAAVVNTAIATEQPLAVTTMASRELAFAAGQRDAVQNTRAYLAAKATDAIHSLDKLSGARAVSSTCNVSLQQTAPLAVSIACQPALQHTLSTHQHSAP